MTQPTREELRSIAHVIKTNQITRGALAETLMDVHGYEEDAAEAFIETALEQGLIEEPRPGVFCLSADALDETVSDD